MALRLAILLAFVLSRSASAQQPINPSSELTGYLRLLEVDGHAAGMPLLHTTSSLAPEERGLRVDTGHVWQARYDFQPVPQASLNPVVSILDSELHLFYNGAIPRTANDGAVWAGRGLSGLFQAGARISWGPLTGRLYPAFVFAQNRSFPLATGPQSHRSVYAYPWQDGIDFPQRFGNMSFHFLDWGQSGIRVDVQALTLGLSTENLWWGPAFRNAIVMTNTAPGFPHVDLGTGRPLTTPIGQVEVRGIWGALSRSRYFGAPTDGRRLLTGVTAGYRPVFLPGLTLGITRVLYREWPVDGIGPGDLFDFFGGLFNRGRIQPDGSVVNDDSDQLASFIARWVLPAAGFEAFIEWARGDFAGSVTDFFLEPEHSQGLTLGFQKTLPSATGRWLLKGEATNLARSQTRLLRDEPTFYVHHLAVGGYTNRGQLLGAGIGPGSNAQYLGLDRYTANGRYGVFIERVRYDDDYAFRRLRDVSYGYLMHQADLTIGASALRFASAFDLGASVELTRQLNRYFQRGNHVTNLKFSLSLRSRMN